jgi:hypothetical protein
MAEALTRPVLEVRDRLAGRGVIQPASPKLAPHNVEDLKINDVWGRLICITC